MLNKKSRTGILLLMICVIVSVGVSTPVVADIHDNLNLGDIDVPSEANVGEEIEINSSSHIPEARFADYTADLEVIATVESEKVGTQKISVKDGESVNISIEHEFQQPGEKEVKLEIEGELERDATTTESVSIDQEIGPQTIDITPENQTAEGAAFAAPESVQNGVDDIRDTIPQDAGPHAFVLTSADELYVIITDEEPQEGHATVAGFTPPDADVVETDEFDFEVVVATDVEFDSPSSVNVSEVAQNPDTYDREFVQISAHHRNIAIDYKRGPPVSTGVLVDDPLETGGLFGSVGSNARSTLDENFDNNNVESALGQVTQDQVVTASFGTEEYWTNGEVTISGITAAPNTPTRDFIESFRDEDILPADSNTPVMYIVEEEYNAEEVSSISEISENAAEFDGELVTVESNFLQTRISTERVFHSATGTPLPVDTILHGGAAWDQIPNNRDDVMLMMAASSVEQPEYQENRTGTYQITGEVISTDRIEGNLPDGSILIIYDLERVGDLDTVANDIVENQASGVSNTLEQQANPNVDTPEVGEGAKDIVQIPNYDELTSTAVWQGQEVQVNLSDSGVDEGDNINLYERIDDDSSRLEDQLIAEEGGVVKFETDDLLHGDYFLSGVGDLPTRSESEEDIRDTFGIIEQSLSAEFDRTIVTDDGSISKTEFEFDSNRGSYPITIHANNDLEPDDLLDIFVNNGPFTAKYTAEGNEGVTGFDEIGIEPVSDNDRYIIYFQEIDAGHYNFSFTGTDTTVETSDTITVELDDEFNIDPAPTFKYEPEFPDSDQTVTFDASGSDDIDGEIVEYRWDFNGDGTTDATGVTPTYSFETEGYYEVSLTVVDNDGGTANTSQFIEVATEDRTQNPEATQEVSRPPHLTVESYDELAYTPIVWQGQAVSVDIGVSNNYVNLYERVDEDTSRLRQELSSNDTGYVTINTEDEIAGDYYLVGGGNLPTRSEAQDNASKTFQVEKQKLSANFEKGTVNNTGPDSTTKLEFSSNRARYPVTVTTSDGSLHAGQLADLFGSATIGGDKAFDVIDLNITGKDEITMTADGMTGISDSDKYELDISEANTSAGQYNFIFSIADSTAEDSSDITVTEAQDTPDKPPEDTFEDVPVDAEAAAAVDQDGDGNIALEDLVQANIERINNPNDEVNGVPVPLQELVELNVWRLNS